MKNDQLKVQEKQIATGCFVIVGIALLFMAIGAAAGIGIYKYFF